MGPCHISFDGDRLALGRLAFVPIYIELPYTSTTKCETLLLVSLTGRGGSDHAIGLEASSFLPSVSLMSAPDVSVWVSPIEQVVVLRVLGT